MLCTVLAASSYAPLLGFVGQEKLACSSQRFLAAPFVTAAIASCDGYGLDRDERAGRYTVQAPPDRGIPAIIVPRQSSDCLALSVSLSNHFALGGVEGRRSTETLALGLRTGNASRASLTDQVAFEFGNAGHDGEHEAAHLVCGVAPTVAK